MTKVEWLNSLSEKSRVGRFSLHDRSYRAKRSLLLVSTLLIVILTFGIQIKSVSSSGIEISTPFESVQIILRLFIAYFLCSFSLFALADFNERPVPEYRNKIGHLWLKAREKVMRSHELEFQAITKKYWSKETLSKYRFSDIERVVFSVNPDLVIDEPSSLRADTFLNDVENNFPNLLSLSEKEEVQEVLRSWQRKMQCAYVAARLRYLVYGFFYIAAVFGLEIIFPILWSVIALIRPDLSKILVAF